ncbi:MAG: hypothetical protein V7765_18405 [Oleispira sp.]
MKYLLTAVLVASSLIVTACDSSLSTIEGGELRKRAYLCVIDTNMSTVDIQICSNIQRECKRRQDAGIFDC